MSWTAVKDELPREHTPVLVCWQGKGTGVFRSALKIHSRGGTSWHADQGRDYHTPPTHWQYMPKHVDKEVADG